MSSISEKAASGFRGEQAAGYDARSRTGIPGYDALHELSVTLLSAELGDEANVLVAGIGTGEEIVRMAPANAGWRFVGVDPSPDMLTIARDRVVAAGASERTDLVEGLVADLPLEPAFDAATLLLVMHFLPDDGAKLALLRDIAARMKPGAPLLLADLYGDPASPAFDLLLAGWRQRVVDAVGDIPAVDESFARIREDITFVPEARIDALLQEAGFGTPVRIWSGLLFGAWLARRERANEGNGRERHG